MKISIQSFSRIWVFALGAVAALAEPAAPEAAGDPWLGVATKRLPHIVAEHLGLTPGSGLSVELVVPDSPAAKAGLQKDDVLVRFGDQKLVVPEQLSALVSDSKPGQNVKIGVLRDAQEMELETALGSRPAEFPKQAARPSEADADPDTDPASPTFDELDAMLGGMLQGGNMPAMEQHLDRMRRHMDKMQKQMEQGMGQGGVQMQVFRLDQGRMQINDADGMIAIEKKDGKVNLTAKDKDGNLLYDGPYETDEDKQKVPQAIRDRADRFNFEGGGFGPTVQTPTNPVAPRFNGSVKPGDRVD